MKSIDGVELKEGAIVFVPGFEGKDSFWKPIAKKLQFNFTKFYADFQTCVEYCKKLNAKQ
jgi:hypothetical protein